MRLIHYFSPMSGYAYLGFGALCEIAARRGVSIEHRPVDIQRVFAAIETVAPARQSPARVAWRRIDMARWADRRGLPLSAQPRFWPIDAGLASRAIIATQMTGVGDAALSEALLAAVWARDLDISEPDVVRMLARECGLDGDAILDAARGEEARARLDANTQAAITAGVIGSPTVFAGDAMFFGQDRLDFLDRALTPEAVRA